MRRSAWIAFLFALVAIIGISASRYWFRLGKGDVAPNFQFGTNGEKNYTLNDFRGQVILLHFWATWCEPCRYEIPSLERFHQDMKDKGLVVLSVALEKGEAETLLEQFRQIIPFSFPVLVDVKGEVAATYEAWGVPETILIDREGNIVERLVGPQNWDDQDLRRKLESVLLPEEKSKKR